MFEKEKQEDDNDNMLILDKYNNLFEMYILNFQTVEGCDLYLIADKTQIDINNYYTLQYIFDNFINGKYLIGTLQYYYKNNNINGIIDNIDNIDMYNDENNDELKLHYTKTKDTPENVAWRTIHWDLFSEFVPK